jgi:hypothetical protein
LILICPVLQTGGTVASGGHPAGGGCCLHTGPRRLIGLTGRSQRRWSGVFETSGGLKKNCGGDPPASFWRAGLHNDPMPGLWVTLDFENSEGWIHDPLGTPEFRPLMERWCKAWNASGRVAQRQLPMTMPNIIKKLSPTDMLGWEMEMSRLVEQNAPDGTTGRCRVISGGHLLRPSAELRIRGDVPIYGRHAATNVMYGLYWLAENLVDRPPREKDVAKLTELLTDIDHSRASEQYAARTAERNRESDTAYQAWYQERIRRGEISAGRQ